MPPSDENRAFCEKQLGRLEGLNFFSQLTETGLRELRDALLTGCSSRPQAELVVDAWIADHAERPTPADLRKIARTINSAIAPRPCQNCDPYAPGYARCKVQGRGAYAGQELEAMDFCNCELGRVKGEAERRLDQDFARNYGKSIPLEELSPEGKIS